MSKAFIALIAVLPLVLTACATSEYDSLHDQVFQAGTGPTQVVDAPFGLIGSAWADPHEQKAEDITLADLPYFIVGLTDPLNVLPAPFGTFYVPWKLIVTVIRIFPFVTWGSGPDGSGFATFALGDQPGPIWYAIGPGIEDIDSFIMPVRETVAADYTPVPHGGQFGKYWKSRVNSHFAHGRHIGNIFKYYFMNANSDQPPFENWFPTALSRDKTTMHKTFDNWIFLYDWDDPYIN